jgi:hypothetical protein
MLLGAPVVENRNPDDPSPAVSTNATWQHLPKGRLRRQACDGKTTRAMDDPETRGARMVCEVRNQGLC